MDPTKERPSGWVDSHRNALAEITLHQAQERSDMAKAYQSDPYAYDANAGPMGFPRSAPRDNGALPQWMQDVGNVKTSIGNTIGSVAAGVGEQYIDPLKVWEPPKKRANGDAGPVHNYLKSVIETAPAAVGGGLDEFGDTIRAAAGKEPTSTYMKERGARPANTQGDPNFGIKRAGGAVAQVASPLALPYTVAAGEIISHAVEADPILGPEYTKRLAAVQGDKQSPVVRNQVAHEVVDSAVARLLAVRDDPNATESQKNAADAAAGLLIGGRIAEFGGPSVGARVLARAGVAGRGVIAAVTDTRANQAAADALKLAPAPDGAPTRLAAYTTHAPGVQPIPDQGVGSGLRDRLGMTKDQFADVSPKQQAAVDNLTAVRLARQTEKTGGFTYSPVTKDEPKTGFAVSPYPQFEAKVPLDAGLPSAIQKFQADHADVLADPNAHMGAWVQDGTVYLDVSVVSKTADEAASVARKFNQQAYYDLAKGETIPVVGVGDAGTGAGVGAADNAGLDVTPRAVEESQMTVDQQEADRAQRAQAYSLAVDEPGIGKQTWTPEEKTTLATLDTGKFKASNIVKHVMARTPDQQNVGRAWYEQLRRDFANSADQLGVDYNAFVGIVASLSPRTMWPRGKFHITEGNNVSRAFDTNFPAKNNVRGAELLVKEWQSNEVLQTGTPAEIRAEIKRVGGGQWTSFPNGVGKPGTGNAEKAIRILNGEDPAKVLPQKTGSFLDNFLGNDQNVTGDVWAIRAALDDSNVKQALTPKEYGQLQNAYRQAAAELGYTPEAVQAIAWDSVKENPRFTQANRFLTAEQKRAANTWDSVAAELASTRSGPPTNPAGLELGLDSPSRSARHLSGHQDATKRVVQMQATESTDAAKAYQIAKAKSPASRTAEDLVAMKFGESQGQGGGKADLGFQNDTFSPPTQHNLPAAKDAMRPALEQVTAPITHEDTLAAAQLSGRTPEEALKSMQKHGQGAQAITEAAIGVEEKMLVADEAASKLKKGGLSREEYVDALFSLREAGAILKDFANASSEAGRTLNARKISMKQSLAYDHSDAAWREALKKIAGSRATPDKIDKLLMDLADVRASGDKAGMMRVLRTLNRGNGWDMAFEFSQANILSAVPTHAVNVYSGLIQHALMFGRVVAETPIHMVMQGDARIGFKGPKAGPEDIAGFAVGYLDGLKSVSGDTYRLLTRRMDFYNYTQGKLEQVGGGGKYGLDMTQHGGAIPGAVGEAVRTPFKALTIEDMFQTAPAFNGRLRQLAARQARMEGLKGTDALKRAAEIARDPSDAMFMEANSFSERYALHTKGARMKAAHELMEHVPGLRYLVRFTTTPTNLVVMGLDHSPVGLLRLKNAKSISDTAAITSEAAIGTAVIGTFMGMLESGEMTGLRPTNKTERDLMEAEGVGPMMIQSSKVPLVGWIQNLPPFNQNNDANKRWVTGSVLGPLIVPYLIAAGIREVESQAANPDPKAMQQAVGAMVRTFADQVPMLQGIKDVQNIMDQPIAGTGDLLAQTAKTFVPGSALLGMFERMTDQYKRKPDGIGQTIQSIIPILAQYGIDVGPLHVTPVAGASDELGRPIPNVNTGGLALFPRAAIKNAPSPSLDENSRLMAFGFPGFTGVTKTTPVVGSGSNAITLSPDGAMRYQEIAGQLTDRLLNELINSPAYAHLSDEDKAKKFQTKVDFARLEARKRLAEEYMGTITNDFGQQSIVPRVAQDKALGIALGMRASAKLSDRADFIAPLLTMIDKDPALRDAVSSELANAPRGPLQSGTISKVTDGNTIVIGDTPTKLYGVEAPAINTPHGREVQKALADFLNGKAITYRSDQQTSFGQSLTEVYADGQPVAQWMIDNGYGVAKLPPETDANKYSLDVYRAVIPLRKQITSDPVMSAEYVRGGQPFGDSTTWEEADRQGKLWQKARDRGVTIYEADANYPVYATYRRLATQNGGKNPVRKRFVDQAEKQGIPLSKFLTDLDTHP